MTTAEVEMLEAADRGEIDQRAICISPETVERMNTGLIDNINAVVGTNDVLYHLGDVFWGHNFDAAKSIRDRINCRTIHHVRGNHDEPGIVSLFSSSEKYVEIIVQKQKIFLCHYPMRSWNNSHRGSWSLYGHVHGGLWERDKLGISPLEKAQLKSDFDSILNEHAELSDTLIQKIAESNRNSLTLDVGVDTHDYRPWSMEEIRQELLPKTAHFDSKLLREKNAYKLGSRKND